MKKTNEDVLEDSTDWLDTPLRSLSAVDSALRCQVCKDFYQTPMITSCSHTFCSLCIRRCLSNDGQCPACRTKDQELKLRNNTVVEDLVEAFRKGRPDVLEFARRPAAEERGPSPKRRRELVESGDEEEAPKKRTRTSGRTAGKRAPPRSQTMIEDTDEEDEDYVPENGFVLCPICQNEVKETTINAHIDRGCMDEPRTKRPISGGTSKKGSIQNPFSVPDTGLKRPERLPQINFSMMKEATLRKRLLEAGINASGNKPLMEKRYTEWITLWNANCDATKPREKAELKRDMLTWERTQGAKAPVSHYSQGSGAQIRDKDFDGKAYLSANRDSFQDLIAQARKKKDLKTSTPEAPGSGEAMPRTPESPRASNTGEDEEISPLTPDGSKPKFPEDSTQVSSSQKPASQYTSALPMLDKDPGIVSDTHTFRAVPP
ncbi:hypothetical protein QTJ16_002453 [Diplocarpon rosae]|uniref:Postreplication repair E3 ubiquitin-protein ligase RAD18 n=1 Tax=Diplocarpon rosae TaxID=946125 RepID=A0AAD9T2C9_9HELO|nr:hypothetical protein QTJ16_002453 [Diplocarpon rosae]